VAPIPRNALKWHSREIQSTKRKRDTIKQLLVSCQKEEARYIIRILQGNLRIGVTPGLLDCALAVFTLF
jgi:ATP-dependent DNA ligase